MGKFFKKILDCIPEFPGIALFKKQDDFVDLKDNNIGARKRKILGRFLFLVCIAIVVFLFQVNLYIANSKLEIKKIKGAKAYATKEYATDKLKKRYTILVLGKENKNRADTIILCHVFLDSGKIHLLSMPRDTRVPILKDGDLILDKLNHTFRWGGLTMLKDSLTRFFHIKIDHSIVVDLKLFRKIIDTLGGVKVDVLKDMYYQDKADGLIIDIKKGSQYLTGKNAEGYVRFRADGMGDLGRIKRQKKFILSFEERLRDLFSFKWKNIAFIGRLPKFFVSLLKDVETDLSADLVFKLLLRFRDMKKGALKHGTLKGEGLYLHVKNYKKKINFFVSSRKDKIASYSWLFQTNEIPQAILDPLNDPLNISKPKTVTRTKSMVLSSSVSSNIAMTASTDISIIVSSITPSLLSTTAVIPKTSILETQSVSSHHVLSDSLNQMDIVTKQSSSFGFVIQTSVLGFPASTKPNIKE
ncbi:MAG: LCP family protein [Candidatus Cloacimonetes bacterium]|nr:LCP family protein [Candidatus Cloacimonadota bacterium]